MQSLKTFKIRRTSKVKSNIESQQIQQVANLKDLRLEENYNNDQQENTQIIDNKIKPKEYQNDQENINCYRFPHSSFCGCHSNCLLESFEIQQIIPGLFIGDFVTGLKTKHLLQHGITHILNVTSKQYTKRKQYFEYLNIDLKNNTEQDAKKFFRISNRFIRNALNDGGKVFIHSLHLQLSGVMAIGYLIGICKIPLKQSLNMVVKNFQIVPHFMKQIETYDLEKMAFVSIQRD